MSRDEREAGADHARLPRAGAALALSISPTGRRSVAAQFFFAPRHLSIVALVIVAAQMQNAVQRQDLDFFGRPCVPSARAFWAAISAEIAMSPAIARFQSRRCGKGKNVGGLIFAAKTPVQVPEFVIRSDQNIDRRAQSGGAARARDKAVERQLESDPRRVFAE